MRSSCLFASCAASSVVRGSSFRKSSRRSGSYLKLGGSCHSTGPSLGPSASTPEAKKLASGTFESLRRRMWVMKRGPFTEKTKSSGVASRQRS